MLVGAMLRSNLGDKLFTPL